MRNITYPEIDNIDLWDKIVSRKHQPARGKLLALRDKVNDRYKFYENHFTDLDKIIPLPKSEWNDSEKELISCYGDNVEFKKARHLLFEKLSVTQKTKCPYCMLSRPNTLEHYFDKDDYPEFSVYIPNLVPCCSECNSDKSTTVFNSKKERNYIHFYHDSLPEKQFLFVRFSFIEPDAVPLVDILLKFSKETYCSRLIRSHFSNLSLLSKYKSSILDRIAPIIEEIQVNHQMGMSKRNITESLHIRLDSLAKHYGNNYWETCVYEGILNSSGFLDCLLSE
ncbi:hypothetical protein [Faecalimonas sp.]